MYEFILIAQDGIQTKAQDGSQTKIQDGSQTKTQDGSQTKAHDGSQKTQDGSQTEAQDGSQTKAQDGSQTKTQDGSQTKAQDGSQTKAAIITITYLTLRRPMFLPLDCAVLLPPSLASPLAFPPQWLVHQPHSHMRLCSQDMSLGQCAICLLAARWENLAETRGSSA